MYYGEKIKLRSLEMDDLDNIIRHWNNPEMRQFLTIQLPASRMIEHKWLERATTLMPWKDGELPLAIEDKKTGEFLGTTSLHNISPQRSSAEFGIAIHNPENFGKGYGTDATRVMLWVAFHVLGLKSVHLTTMEHNSRGQRVYEKAGFKKAGVYRQSVFVEGEFKDNLIYDILKEEFLDQFPPGTTVGTHA
ncbi:MAG: GNAT family N-acetyltransferase [Candidatus Thorarchaeota archaeon]